MRGRRREGAGRAFHAGFILGARINAGGRHRPRRTSARACSPPRTPTRRGRWPRSSTRSTPSARRWSARCSRRRVAPSSARPTSAGRAGAAWCAGEGWHPGVIGIVAGRLRERYRKPVVVIGVDPAAGIGKGSGRSQPGINLGRAVQAAFEEGLLLAGGGHAMAAGLTVRGDAIAELPRLPLRAARRRAASAEAQDALDIDAVVSARAADRGAARRPSSGWRRSARAIPSRCSRSPTCAPNGSCRCAAGTCAASWSIRTARSSRPWPGARPTRRSGARLLAGGGAVHVAGPAETRRLERPRGRPARDRGPRRSEGRAEAAGARLARQDHARSTSLDGRKYNIACGQIDIGNAATEMAMRIAEGVPQADGSIRPEPLIDPSIVADAVLYMASLPLDANVQFMTVMATKMPFIGRG